ncbi:YdeI/OmpD-associated family protein [Rubrivirga sp.]|uniref:YdeI/OmpD-associated family protein n=1 Tax=Rubrivirga sp. TaxID=1885344 RepID=UPI003C790002
MQLFAGPVLCDAVSGGMHYVPVPPEVDDALEGARAVVGTLCDVPFRRVVHGRKNGTPHLRFGKQVLRRAGLSLGDTAFIEVEPTDPATVHLPPEFEAALEADPDAAARFSTFSAGKQRSLGTHVAYPTRAETRERRAVELCEKIRTHTLHDD